MATHEFTFQITTKDNGRENVETIRQMFCDLMNDIEHNDPDVVSVNVTNVVFLSDRTER